jgi:hypothetical protein
VSEGAWRCLGLLEDAFDETAGRFGSRRSIGGEWLDETPTNESHGRALVALAEAIATSPDPAMVEKANALFDRALPKTARLPGLRAQACLVLACAIAPDPNRDVVLRSLGTDLHARFRSFAQPGWPWPEREVTPESALLPRAMIVAGGRLGATTMQRIGVQVLDWLIELQSAPDGRLSLLGDTGWERATPRPRFDQRPTDATALILACEAALAVTGADRYRQTMERAYAWFLGENDLRAKLADLVGGSCRDALTPSGPSETAGAESTLAWLVAVEHIRALRPEPAPRRGARSVAVHA